MKLTILGLPIGNIEDISIRQIKALFSAELILAEDTRNYLKVKSIIKERFPEILKVLELNPEHRPELISYREQNHDQILPKILNELKTKNFVCLVSDAGMPTISDPGFRLVEAVLNNGGKVDVIPGPTAIESALSISGLATDRFSFIGFLPRQNSKIKKLIDSYLNLENTVIFYESPFRIIKVLEFFAENYPEVQIVLCNDITKKFETTFRGTANELLNELQPRKIQGEWVGLVRK